MAENGVAAESVEPGEDLLIANAEFGLFEAAEGQEGLAACFRGGHAGVEVVVDVKLEVRGKFIVQFSVELGIVEEVAEAKECGTEGVHEA
jgi:hypothetical protein